VCGTGASLVPWLFERLLALSLLVFSGLVAVGEAHALASPTLITDTEIASAGYFRLSWTVPDSPSSVEFELQQSSVADFSNHKTVYTGPDRATTFSGLANGDYYFRIRSQISDQISGQKSGQTPDRTTDQPSAWSAVTKVQVQHHSLTRAWLFFILGAAVFTATLALVLRGATENKNK